MNTTNRVKQHHIVPDSFEAITLKLSMVFPSTDPVFENWSFYTPGQASVSISRQIQLLLHLPFDQ